jgi:glycerol-3-phosphate acyltransferase PlsY
MDLSAALLVTFVGYLLGSISFTRLLTNLLAPGQDITSVQVPLPGTDKSFEVTAQGANTASMVLGSRIGCLIGILDILKGALPTWTVMLIYPGQAYFLLVAVACMVGHNWSIFHRFKGGRGISVFYGSLLVIDWLAVPVTSLGGFLIGLILLRNYGLVFLISLWLLIPWMWFRTQDVGYLAYAIVVNIILILAMIPDFKRYRELQRQGGLDQEAFMESSAMGRGMLRIGRRLGLFKNPPSQPAEQHPGRNGNTADPQAAKDDLP